MSSRGDATLPAARRPRKSIGGGPSPSRKMARKENATVDVGNALAAAKRKSRSKSMGPGGLDVLKSGAGNRRVSLAAPSRPPPRSILKPSPSLLPEIPPHRPKSSAGRAASEEAHMGPPSDSDTPATGTRIALRTEEEQQAAAREREEREGAEAEKEARDRREARRKSLANRRVSFAAEATLHTFHEIDFMQDLTTSTESSRRASSLAGQSSAHRAQGTSGPDRRAAAEHDGESDGRQGKRRRSSGVSSMSFRGPADDAPSSTAYSSDSEHADDVTEMQGEELSGSDSDVEDGTVMTVEADEMTSASIASAAGAPSPGASFSLDENLRLAARRAVTQQLDEDEEAIPAFVGWGKKSKASQEAIQNAQRSSSEAAVQSPAAPDEGGAQMDPGGAMEADMDMDMDVDMDVDMDMDITNAVGRIIKRRSAAPQQDQGDDMSMDVTRVLGGIISQSKPSTRRRSAAGPGPGTEGETLDEGESMELTTAVGRIRPRRASDESQPDLDGYEDMSMELTTAVGGVLATGLPEKALPQSRRRTLRRQDDDGQRGADETAMDVTVGIGRILPADGGGDEDGGEATMGMEMTTALGGILNPHASQDVRTSAKKVMEQEVNEPDALFAAAAQTPSPTGRPPSPTRQQSPLLAGAPAPAAGPAAGALPRQDETESPGAAAHHGRTLRRTPVRDAQAPGTPRSEARTPARSPAGTPQMIGSQSSSPMRYNTSPGRGLSTPQSALISKLKRTSLFHQDPATGCSTPRVVLTPQGRRRLSGVGADRAGLGSPRVVEILDRRDSIGDSAELFAPGQSAHARRGVAFAAAAQEIEGPGWPQQEGEAEDAGGGGRHGRTSPGREATGGGRDDRNATLSLKEMIENLSPRKNPSGGRKSLHVGSARGLLGKRPAELDELDDEPEGPDGIKRLRGHQGSPVRNIRLQSPPSKAETTGRAARPAGRPSTGGPSPDRTTTPRGGSPGRRQQQQRGVAADGHPSPAPATGTTSPGRRTASPHEGEAAAAQDGGEAAAQDGGPRMQLQDFLDMTSIRFMELNTTKRRHTIAPAAAGGGGGADGEDGSALEACVVAGACTVPMLELYQHSCRELKKYISEGRRIVREIETEVFEENPPLFREYMSAGPEFRLIMDNQFKNVKTHARLLSKAMWYEWRMKLQEGLREGLATIAEGMDADDALFARQEELLASALPDMLRRHDALERERAGLEASARELADCDPEDLEAARSELTFLDADIERREERAAELRRLLQESEDDIAAAGSRKEACLGEIRASEQVREGCRGWSSTEILGLQAKVEQLEKQHGWAVTGIAGTTVSMTYKREIELVLDVSSLQRGRGGDDGDDDDSSARIDVRYVAGREPSAEKAFFLQRIRDQLQRQQRRRRRRRAAGAGGPGRVLGVVGAAWDKAAALAGQVRLLNVTFPTTLAPSPDGDALALRASLLVAPLRSRVEVVLDLRAVAGDDDDGGAGRAVEVAIAPRAEVVYGEPFKVARVAEFLAARLGDRVLGPRDVDGGPAESWSDVFAELHGRLLARGEKGAAGGGPLAGEGGRS